MCLSSVAISVLAALVAVQNKSWRLVITDSFILVMEQGLLSCCSKKNQVGQRKKDKLRIVTYSELAGLSKIFRITKVKWAR